MFSGREYLCPKPELYGNVPFRFRKFGRGQLHSVSASDNLKIQPRAVLSQTLSLSFSTPHYFSPLVWNISTHFILWNRGTRSHVFHIFRHLCLFYTMHLFRPPVFTNGCTCQRVFFSYLLFLRSLSVDKYSRLCLSSVCKYR